MAVIFVKHIMIVALQFGSAAFLSFEKNVKECRRKNISMQ